MSRWWAVMTAFVLGSWQWVVPTMHWNNVADWPARLLLGAFVLWLARDPERVA